jgi:hypothetical protein
MYNPLACMCCNVGHKIGSLARMVEEVEVDEDEVGWGKYLTMKIRKDLSKPLSRGRILKLKGNSMWVPFQYERLPKFCFNCGIIRHGIAGCLKRSANWNNGEYTQDGPWLRAAFPNWWRNKGQSRFGTSGKWR